MKALIASAFALGLLGASVVPAAAVSIHIGSHGVRISDRHHGHHRHCTSWGWHHHERYCRRYGW